MSKRQDYFLLIIALLLMMPFSKKVVWANEWTQQTRQVMQEDRQRQLTDGFYQVMSAIFIVGIVGAAFVACYSELKHVPAHLMRPKAPKEGSRVFLEYIKPLWKRMSFLNKVTARNLFRYKKRMFMTLFGIMGCTALLVFGLAIKDSVDALMPLQYENVYSYDLLAATSGDDNDKLVSYAEERTEITEYLNIQVETIKLKNEDKASEKVQLMVLPKGADISRYFSLMDENLEPISIGNTGIYLTENASRILDLKVGDTAYIQKLDLTQEAVQITSLVKNYLGNNIYMSQEAYEEVFGEYEPNGILANLSEECADQIAFAEELASEDWILSSVSTEDLKATFSQAFTLINIGVYVVLVSYDLCFLRCRKDNSSTLVTISWEIN